MECDPLVDICSTAEMPFDNCVCFHITHRHNGKVPLILALEYPQQKRNTMKRFKKLEEEQHLILW